MFGMPNAEGDEATRISSDTPPSSGAPNHFCDRLSQKFEHRFLAGGLRIGARGILAFRFVIPGASNWRRARSMSRRQRGRRMGLPREVQLQEIRHGLGRIKDRALGQFLRRQFPHEPQAGDQALTVRQG